MASAQISCCTLNGSPLVQPFTLTIKEKQVLDAWYSYKYSQIRFINWFFFGFHIIWYILKFGYGNPIDQTVTPILEVALLLVLMILQAGSFKVPRLLYWCGPIWFLIHCIDLFIESQTGGREFITLIFKLVLAFVFFNTQWIVHTVACMLMLGITMLFTVSSDFNITFTESIFIVIVIYLNYHLEQTYKESYCEKFVSQRNHLEFRGMLNNLKDGIFIARKDQRLKVDYINRAAKILLSQNPVDLETGLLQGHSQAQQLALQGANAPVNPLIQDIDENESYADKKCFVRYDGTNLAEESKVLKPGASDLLNLKDILALQQQDTLTAQSFRVYIENDTSVAKQEINDNMLIVAIEIQNIIFQGEESIIIYIHNISQLADNQRMKQVNQSQELLQATVSHELRTPLNVILLMCQLLQGSKLSEQGQYFARQIQVSSNLLLCFVNDLLDYSQIKNGIYNPIVLNFSFRQVVDDVLQIFIFQAKAQETLLMFSFSKEIPTMLRGDKTRLQQVLINLVKNALKFTHLGYIKVKADYNYEKQLLIVQVIDNGKGIKEEEKIRLFTMFGKLQRTADVNQEGIGLGLTICKELCSKNGGEITVESQGEALGSTFTFSMKMLSTLDDSQDANDADLQSGEFQSQISQEDTQVFECQEILLSQINVADAGPKENQAVTNPWANECPVFFDIKPALQPTMGPTLKADNKSINELNQRLPYARSAKLAKSANKQQKGDEKKQANQKEETRNSNAVILAVDDSTFNLEALQLIMNIHFKVQCETAVSGAKSLEMIEERLKNQNRGQKPYQLVFMDYSMPQMNGLETSQNVLKLYQKYNTKEPIICCLTAYTEKNFKDNAKLAGMQYFVTKPADKKSIGDVLKLIDVK